MKLKKYTLYHNHTKILNIITIIINNLFHYSIFRDIIINLFMKKFFWYKLVFIIHLLNFVLIFFFLV